MEVVLWACRGEIKGVFSEITQKPWCTRCSTSAGLSASALTLSCIKGQDLSLTRRRRSPPPLLSLSSCHKTSRFLNSHHTQPHALLPQPSTEQLTSQMLRFWEKMSFILGTRPGISPCFKLGRRVPLGFPAKQRFPQSRSFRVRSLVLEPSRFQQPRRL